MEFGDTIKVYRDTPSGVDPKTGDPLGTAPPPTTITGCGVAPLGYGSTSGSEDVFRDGREVTSTDRILFAPYGADIRRHDRVEHNGVMYQVNGSSWDAANALTGWQAGTIAQLKVIEGR